MAKRTWKIEAQPVHGEDGALLGYRLDRDEVRQALLDIEAMGHLSGGSFVLHPLREPLEDSIKDLHETTGWIMAWESSAPRVRKPKPVEVAPEPELEPVAAGDE